MKETKVSTFRGSEGLNGFLAKIFSSLPKSGMAFLS
jgi:hypothetical protein